MLFTCIKSRFFRNHLANFHQISHWSFCWNVIDPSVEMWLIVYSNDHAPLTVRPIYSSSKLRTAQMMIFSLVAMIGLEKCCITSACLQWLCHSGERIVARGPLVYFSEKSVSFCYSFGRVMFQFHVESWINVWNSFYSTFQRQPSKIRRLLECYLMHVLIWIE